MGILDGIVEWIAEQIMYGLDLINTSVLGALGCDMNMFLRYFPAAETMYSLLVALAIGLILLSKLALCLLLAMSLTVSAFAAQVPDSLVAENLNGQQRLVKTYTLSPEDDPGDLKEDDFSYPNARWEWLADKPSRFAVEGGTARIRVYGVPDYDYADVTLDQKANLDCSLVKLSPLAAGTSNTQPPNRQPVNPRVWFETRGRSVLEALVTDLNSRGHSSLAVQENGEVFVQTKENEAEPAKETFLDFPEKVYWPQLVKVLKEEGYAADARDADILVSW